MAKPRSMLVPSYMQKFNCIGSACEDTCCAGWQVTIDKNTYKKYNKVRSELKSALDNHVKRNRTSKSSEDYAKIVLNSELSCPMLNDKKLCSIQLKLGESYLSNTCATYPRVSNEVNGILEKSATMSCPEVARLALLNPNGIEFDETEEPADIRLSIKNRLDTKVGQQPQVQLQQYFWELRIFSIQTLQNRNFSLADRLIILGMFYQKVEQYIQDGQIQEIPQLIASYTVMVEGNGLANMLTDIPVLSTIQMELLKNLIDTRMSHGVRNQRYIDCFGELLHGIQYAKESSVEEISSCYQVAYNDFYLPFMSKHEYILENYLVNYVYLNLFPLGNGSDIFEEYIMMVIHYAMIKMHLIGMAGYHKENFGVEQIIKLIQSFGKVIEHSPLYLREVRELLRKNEYNSMAYMAILIKNN
ncbi:flagellin lysine-N-methylase [Paenibacillus glacialis]|uniref:Lysine-N-methylase n=1 Tax=Paenibacillus glacialis TaxID=494026 RepID=A0A162Q5Q1_9BACL|nr:flagellin lysine-N-methylase [Paenibacillus glacialis]OAB42940.1 lysine-N-methylase [Paenibacillus glacialis]